MQRSRTTPMIWVALALVAAPLSASVVPAAEGRALTDFGSTPILSTFTGPDETPLSEGGNWAKLNPQASGDLRRITEQAADTGANGGSRYWTPADFGPDVEAYVTVATRPSDTIDPVGVAARIQGEGGSNTWDG